VTYFADGCSTSRRNTSIAVRLSNEASGALARYLTQRTDKPAKGTPAGQSRYEISLYVTSGAQLRSATLDGKSVTLRQVSEGGRPVFVLETTVERRGTRVLTVQLSEPSVPGVPDLPVQPLLRPQQTVVDAPVCGPR
jgi:hypothetical protein